MKKKKKQFLDLAKKYTQHPAVPLCAHFGQCGGCMFQNISYEDQLLLKKEYLSSTLEFDVGAVHPASPYRYRNRMDFVTAFGKAGLRKPGSFRHVVDIGSCEIMQEKSNDLFKKIRPMLGGIEDYNYLTHEGYLRYVVVRQGKYTGQLMCNFVVAQRDNRLDGLIGQIAGGVDSVSIILSDGRADLSFGEVLSDVKNGSIEESLDGIRFRIRPNSFFQSNSGITLQMYNRIRSEVSGRVLDLYCGVGSISLFVAKNAGHVTGVEILDEAVQTAVDNRNLNEIGNVDFIRADALEFMRENGKSFDTVIMDPPRSGIHPKTIRCLREMAPEKIIYMSCNPATFRDDLRELDTYTLTNFEAFDMFPQTPHIETLAVLTKN